MAGDSSADTASGPLKRLYDYCMDWIAGPYGAWTLFIIAFVESSFFPLPPDVFLIAMCIAAPTRAFKYAAICSVGSVLGGMLGYGLGLWFMDSLGQQIIGWYGLEDKYLSVQNLYQKYDAGAFEINFITFVVASLVSRSARFFLVAAFIWKFGAPVKDFIDKYFNIISVVFMFLLIGGFVLIKYLL